MTIDFICYGISHKTADLSIREKYALTTLKKKEIISEIFSFLFVKEMVVLSTCNRTELYAVVENIKEFLDAVAKILKIKNEDFKYFYLLKNEHAIKHLFKVASGLESQILGENEILHQVKEAYFFAKELGITKYYLNVIFHKTITVAKKVKTQTGISKNNISIGSITLNLIEEFFGNLENKVISIIGTGTIAELVSRYLFNKKAKIFFVSNKHYDKALQLAEKFNGYAIRLENNLEAIIIQSDVIITATLSPHTIIKKSFLNEIICKHSKVKVLIIDLSVPRNVEPDVETIEGVFLYDLDKIKQIIEKNYNIRILEKEKAEMIIEKEVNDFCDKLNFGLLYKNLSPKLYSLSVERSY